MIRWRFIGIRLLVVVAAIVLLRWTLNPLAHWMIVRSLEQSVGAKVEIASTDIGLFPPRAHLTGVTVADPRKEFKNLFAADDISLEIDGDALLKRRYEVSSGRITGIRIGGKRETSGALDIEENEPEPVDEGPSALSMWVEQLSGDAQENIENFGESLATVNESKRIRDYWENEYKSLRARAKQLEDNVKSLKTTAKSIDNPLRDLPALQETLRKAEEIKRELIFVRQRLDTMPGQIRGDMVALDQARRADQQRVQAFLPEGVSLEEGNLGPDLLTQLVQEQLKQVREYLDSGRAIADVTVASPKSERSRGEDVLLGGPKGPGWLVQRCEVSGVLSANDEEYQLIGVVENITTDHAAATAPLHARLRLEGPRVVRIEYQRHYEEHTLAGRPPRDHLKIHWPRLPMPNRTIGNANDAALVIDGGQMELWVEIETQGDQIQGHLVSRQTETQLAVAAKPKLAENVFIRSLNQSLAEVDQVDVDAKFSGTWRKMDLNIATSLTDQISSGMRGAIDASIIEARQRLASRVDQEYQKHSRELETWLGDQQKDARDLLAKADEAVESMSKKVVAELGGPDAYLGRVRGGLNRLLK